MYEMKDKLNTCIFVTKKRIHKIAINIIFYSCITKICSRVPYQKKKSIATLLVGVQTISCTLPLSHFYNSAQIEI